MAYMTVYREAVETSPHGPRVPANPELYRSTLVQRPFCPLGMAVFFPDELHPEWLPVIGLIVWTLSLCLLRYSPSDLASISFLLPQQS